MSDTLLSLAALWLVAVLTPGPNMQFFSGMALSSSVRALAAAGAGIADARLMFAYQKAHAPLRRTVTVEEIGGSALYLLSDLSSGVTGEIHYVDSGYNVISMPRPEVLKAQDAAGVTGEE